MSYVIEIPVRDSSLGPSRDQVLGPRLPGWGSSYGMAQVTVRDSSLDSSRDQVLGPIGYRVRRVTLGFEL